MSTNFPTSLDSYSALVDNTDNIVAAHPNNRGDAIEALEAKVGIDSSAVATSHDYLLTNLPAQDVDWDAGGIEIRAQTFESDVATGTAPFTIASTTVCTNLNADQVDGKDVNGSNGAGEITTNDGTQTLTSKTLTSPDINGGTWNGTIDGSWTAASQTCADLGAVTTCDINGGTVNGLTSLGLSTGTDITEISTDGTMAGNSDNAVPTEKAVKTYADSVAPSFGSWVDKSGGYGAQQASTDGFVVVATTGNASTDYVYGYTDSASDPTTIRCRIGNGFSTETNSFMMPVKSGDYWKVTKSGSITINSVYWIPLS